MRHVLVWRGLDAPRMEIARAEVVGGELRAEGTQVGAAYELRYGLGDGRLEAAVVGGRRVDLGLDGADFFDLGYSPLFNSLPVLAGLEEPTLFVMAFVDVPSLKVARSEQWYEPLGGGLVRFRSGSFVAELAFDEDGFVTRYEGLAERVGCPCRSTSSPWTRRSFTDTFRPSSGRCSRSTRATRCASLRPTLVGGLPRVRQSSRGARSSTPVMRWPARSSSVGPVSARRLP